ncbi:MAG: hypothetical protein CMJ19_10730 [Phycisphaeraceae bacterium]|nr:hypothetical protein [Phycisphaeraceae bacterium]
MIDLKHTHHAMSTRCKSGAGLYQCNDRSNFTVIPVIEPTEEFLLCSATLGAHLVFATQVIPAVHAVSLHGMVDGSQCFKRTEINAKQ